jgi:hypothetical protein
MANESERAERRALIAKLGRREGTIDEAERWVARLKELDPLFYGSDYMLGLERDVRARRIYDQFVAELGDNLSRSQLVDLVAKVQRVEGAEEEIHAWMELLERNVPDPYVSDLIFNSKEELTAEEVIERAFAYQPILLGPIPNSSTDSENPDHERVE